MPQSKPSKYNNKGFAPVWIILLIFLLGGIFIFGKGNLNSLLPSKSNSNNRDIPVMIPNVSPQASSDNTKIKIQSLYGLCKSEIQSLPKLPFVYEKITPTGSNAELYRKDRIKDKKNLQDYTTCGLGYSTVNVVEKAYASMGLQYYEYSKTDRKIRWINTTSVKQLPKNIDNIYGEILKKQGWTRQTKEGGERLAYDLPTLIFYKDMGDKNYYIDVVVGPSPASLYLLIVKK